MREKVYVEAHTSPFKNAAKNNMENRTCNCEIQSVPLNVDLRDLCLRM